MKNRGVATILVLFNVSLSCLSAEPIFYNYTNIGSLLPGSSTARGLNDLGQVVGEYSSGTVTRSFLWDPHSGITDLGTGIAFDINNNGEVLIEDGNIAYRWNNGVRTEVVNLGSGGEVYRINDLGQIVGFTSQSKGFVWQDNELTFIGSLGGGTSNAIGVNDYGTVVGWATNSSDETRMIYWDQYNGMRDVGAYNSYERSYSLLIDINNNNLVIGAELNLTGGVSFESYWGYGKPPAYIGTGLAWSINDHGQVVGEDSNKAFYWDVYDRKIWLKDYTINFPSSYSLSEAYEINELGQIVGSGTAGAYLLTPVPEPCTLLLIGFGGLFLRSIINN